MLRAVGLLLVVATGAFAGLAGSGALRKRMERLAKLRMALSEMAVELCYCTPTVWELLDRLCEQPQYAELAFLERTRAQRPLSFAKAWAQSVCEDASLGAQERDVLLSLGATLGTTDVEGQLSALSLHMDKLEALYHAERERYAQKGRLYRSLGVLGGTFLAILLA